MDEEPLLLLTRAQRHVGKTDLSNVRRALFERHAMPSGQRENSPPSPVNGKQRSSDASRAYALLQKSNHAFPVLDTGHRPDDGVDLVHVKIVHHSASPKEELAHASKLAMTRACIKANVD